jgi:hypothetical protein
VVADLVRLTPPGSCPRISFTLALYRSTGRYVAWTSMKKTEYNPRLRAAILQVVENQLRDNNPPETRQTLDRLVKEGHSREEAKSLIESVVAAETFYVLKNQESFNHKRFVEALNKLPQLPGEE